MTDKGTGRTQGPSEQPDQAHAVRVWPLGPPRGESTHLLLVERDRASVPLVSEMLRASWPEPMTFTHAERIDDANQQLLSGSVTALLLGDDDHSILEHVRAVAPSVPVIILATEYSDTAAVIALRAGAQDYLSTRDLTPTALRRRLMHAIERKHAELQLAHRALQDPLTGLPNRTLFMDRLGVALDRIRRTGSMIAVLFLDVDGFKLINDSQGHAAGDRVLTALAGRLRSALRPMDTVARFGGDEFIFLFEGLATTAEAVPIAERVQEVASLPIRLGDQMRALSVSIGVATAADPDVPPDELIAQADGAMYHAKARRAATNPPPDGTGAGSGHGPAAGSQAGGTGAGLWPAEGARDESIRAGSDLRDQLRGAVERAELRVVYQPVFQFASGQRVSGFEALVRWEHPERGTIAPREFLPLTEEMGVLGAIGQFVLEEALGLLARLLPSHAGLTASVNLSHDQLREPDLTAAVAAIGSQGIEPSLLYVEIPEQIVTEDPGAAIHAAEVLRAAGVRVAVDDYGTGSTPLGDLRRLRPDVLKIHESIVGELGGASADGAMVGAVVDLAHALGMKVVAEGVETDEQLAGLQTLGCDAAQGYLLCRPMRGDQLEELVMHGS